MMCPHCTFPLTQRPISSEYDNRPGTDRSYSMMLQCFHCSAIITITVTTVQPPLFDPKPMTLGCPSLEDVPYANRP